MNSITENWNDNFSHSIGKNIKHRYQSFTRIRRRFHSPSAKGVPYMANNGEYLCRDFFVGFNFWSRLSFQISEFRVHWLLWMGNDGISSSLTAILDLK